MNTSDLYYKWAPNLKHNKMQCWQGQVLYYGAAKIYEYIREINNRCRMLLIHALKYKFHGYKM